MRIFLEFSRVNLSFLSLMNGFLTFTFSSFCSDSRIILFSLNLQGFFRENVKKPCFEKTHYFDFFLSKELKRWVDKGVLAHFWENVEKYVKTFSGDLLWVFCWKIQNLVFINYRKFWSQRVAKYLSDIFYFSKNLNLNPLRN